jgi:hypothetical protein
MMRAVATVEGKKRYLFGLDATNVKRLLAFEPIYFEADELGLPGHAFVIASVQNPLQAKKLFDHFQGQGRHKKELHAINLMESAIKLLKAYPVELDHLKIGKVVLLYAETQEEFAKALGFTDVTPVPKGQRDVFDPISGKLVRRPEGGLH